MPTRPSRNDQIKKLLLSGVPVPAVARRLKCTKRWVYSFSLEHKLPRNVAIRSGSPLEHKILCALVLTNRNIPVVARVYSQAPSNIHRLIARIRKDKHR